MEIKYCSKCNCMTNTIREGKFEYLCGKCGHNKGCRKEFNHRICGDRICGQFEDLKHSDHYIYCDECSSRNGEKKQ